MPGRRLSSLIPAVAPPHPLTACAFAAGACLAWAFLSSMWGGSLVGWLVVSCAGLVATLVWLGSKFRYDRRRRRRWLGWACLPLAVAMYVLWAYLAAAFGVLLGWTVPFWGVVSLAVLTAVSLLTTVRRDNRLRLPLILPVGIWIAAVLSGWVREEHLVRCDDYLALPPSVDVAVENPRLAACRPGEIRQSGRYPRTLWQSPDPGRIRFTTQGRDAAGGFPGAVCEAFLDRPGRPVACVGQPSGKSQALIEVPALGRMLAFHWGLETPSGTMGASIYELPLDEGIGVLEQHWFDEMLGEGFYEPRNSTLYLYSDRMNGVHRLRLPDFEPMPTIPSNVAPGEISYDRSSGEGVACAQQIGIAIGGAPFSERSLLGPEASIPERLSLTWGCDWDENTRKVYTAVPNLGMIVRFDYDTGRVEKRWFVGLGVRSLDYDRSRRRIYYTDFLRGYVGALDEASETVVGRWFVGRFSRWVEPSRDGRSLLATSSLGVLRIALD